jgi:hypothetical protein
MQGRSTTTKRSTEQQNNRHNHASLKKVIEPEILPYVQTVRHVLNEIDSQSVKEINAVAHSANVGNHAIAENSGADAPAKRSQIKHNNHNRQRNMADYGRQSAPDARSAARGTVRARPKESWASILPAA